MVILTHHLDMKNSSLLKYKNIYKKIIIESEEYKLSNALIFKNVDQFFVA